MKNIVVACVLKLHGIRDGCLFYCPKSSEEP
nr:MAG TPA: hypothetical protein [Caudoviricetes sp.]